MSPYEQAMRAYTHPTGMTFDEMLAWTFNTGFVHSTPKFFVCGRPVFSGALHRQIADPATEFANEACDAWYVHLAAGDLAAAFGVLPWPLPLIGFDRQGEVRFYQLEQVRRLTRQPSTS